MIFSGEIRTSNTSAMEVLRIFVRIILRKLSEYWMRGNGEPGIARKYTNSVVVLT